MDPKVVAQLLDAKDVYAGDAMGASKLLTVYDRIEVNCLEENVTAPLTAKWIPIGTLLPLMNIVYLDFEAEGKPLGRLRILLTCGQRRREAMLRLCTGMVGKKLKGHHFKDCYDAGASGERARMCQYLNSTGSKCSQALVAGMEKDECNRFYAGAVTGNGYTNDNNDFYICTKTNYHGKMPDNRNMFPEIGKVVAGLEMFSEAIQKYKGDMTQIKIVQTGAEVAN